MCLSAWTKRNWHMNGLLTFLYVPATAMCRFSSSDCVQHDDFDVLLDSGKTPTASVLAVPLLGPQGIDGAMNTMTDHNGREAG